MERFDRDLYGRMLLSGGASSVQISISQAP